MRITDYATRIDRRPKDIIFRRSSSEPNAAAVSTIPSSPPVTEDARLVATIRQRDGKPSRIVKVWSKIQPASVVKTLKDASFDSALCSFDQCLVHWMCSRRKAFLEFPLTPLRSEFSFASAPLPLPSIIRDLSVFSASPMDLSTSPLQYFDEFGKGFHEGNFSMIQVGPCETRIFTENLRG